MKQSTTWYPSQYVPAKGTLARDEWDHQEAEIKRAVKEAELERIARQARIELAARYHTIGTTGRKKYMAYFLAERIDP